MSGRGDIDSVSIRSRHRWPGETADGSRLGPPLRVSIRSRPDGREKRVLPSAETIAYEFQSAPGPMAGRRPRGPSGRQVMARVSIRSRHRWPGERSRTKPTERRSGPVSIRSRHRGREKRTSADIHARRSECCFNPLPALEAGRNGRARGIRTAREWLFQSAPGTRGREEERHHSHAVNEGDVFQSAPGTEAGRKIANSRRRRRVSSMFQSAPGTRGREELRGSG